MRQLILCCAWIGLVAPGGVTIADSKDPEPVEQGPASRTGEAADNVLVEAAVFSNGDVRLVGDYYKPGSAGPHPVVVFTHGSGGAGRDNGRYIEEAKYFARQGIASLVFDKRGYGESEGDWRSSSFEDLALDAIAAVEYVKSRDDTDDTRIGLRGASQSGWVLPLAASMSGDIRFLILISPAGMTPYDQILYDVRTDVEDAGFSPAEAEQALTVIGSALQYARTLQDWERHETVLAKYENEAWLSIASGPPVPDHWMWSWIGPLLDYDSIPIVETLHLPTLVLLGENDREVASQVAGFRYQKALDKSEARNLVRYFPGADHSLRQTVDVPDGARAPFADGFLDTMSHWVLTSAE